MSNTDSFIDEVTEEVRRDRLFALMRRYGWIAVACVLLLVGAASWNEWTKAQQAARAQAFGDALMGALEQDDPAARRSALSAIDGTPEQRALVAMFAAQEADSIEPAATGSLAALSENPDLAQVYRDLALLKFVMRPDSGLSPEDKVARLEPLTIPGAPYRLLALEQTALARIDTGDADAALVLLKDILGEDRVSEGLRRRVSQLIVALGGTLDAA